MDDNSERLRARAKEKLRQGNSIDTTLYETDLKVLVEELSIYQIELEHQNQELIHSQEHLQQSNDRYIDLFDNAPIGYMIVDIYGVIKDINQTAALLLERSKNEFADTKITKFIHPDYQDIYYLYFQALISQKQFHPCDIKLRKSNNNYFYARIQGVCQTREIDHEAEFRLAISDISIQKEMELKLLAAKALTEQSEERFQLLFNQAPLGYQSLDSEGRFIDINQQWLDTLGYEREEVIGNWFGDFLTPEFKDGFRERFPMFMAQGHIHSEFEMMHKNGSILYIAFDGKIGTDIDGNFKQTHCILQDITEIKITQNALLEAEWKYKALFELGPIGVAYHRMIYDESGKPIDYYFIDANASYNELTGVNPKGMTVRQAFPGIENDPFDWIGKFGHVAKTGETIRFEQYLESNQRWYDCVGYQYKPDHFVAAFNEITQRKKAEETLQKSEENLSITLHSIGDGVISTDINGLIVNMNPVAEKLCGWTLTEATGKPLSDVFKIINADTRQSVADPVEKVLEFGEIVGLANHTILISKDGSEFQIADSAAPIKNKESKIMGVVLVFSDVTGKYAAELALKQSEERYALVIDASEQGIWDWNVETNEIYFSEQWKKQIGYEDYELKNDLSTWEEHLHPEEKEYCMNAVNAYLNNPFEHYILEFRFRHKDGTYRWIHNKSASLKNNKGKVIRMFGSHTDITEQKQIEQELIKAKEQAEESDLLKSAFLANMSHEIRTPMNGILGFAELLKEPELSGEEQQQYIRIIEKSGARMLNIINDIIDISKIEAGLMNLNLIETNINENIEYLYTFFKPEVEAKGIELLFHTPLSAQEATITTDSEKVYAILTNLVKNAIKYTNHGSIELGYQKRGDYLEFYVKDTGIGVAKKRREAIFERFIQADISDKMARQGAGLGLAITRAYVEMLGGKIWVESLEGFGSTFYFTLPHTSEPKHEPVVQQLTFSDKVEELRKLNILIAEDDEVSEMLLDKIVKFVGKEILKARTGLEAVDVCKKNSDIDLVLMDIRMPEMSGFEATCQIRKFNKDVIIIAQTAYGLTGDREKAVEAGCNDYIAKPINKTELFELILKYFGK